MRLLHTMFILRDSEAELMEKKIKVTIENAEKTIFPITIGADVIRIL